MKQPKPKKGRPFKKYKTSVIYKRVPEQIKSELIAQIDKKVNRFIQTLTAPNG